MQMLRFDYRELFRAPRLALSAQRIWMQFVGMSIGYLFYLLFTYLAFLLNGMPFAEIWERYGLVPCLFAATGAISWYAWVLFTIGLVGLMVAFLITNTAVARVTYMVAKGNHFYSLREGFSFALRKAGAVLATPAAILMLLAGLVIGSMVLGLIGHISYLGELFVGLFSIIWFLFALLFIYLLFVLFMSIILTPSILATTDEDAFEAVFQTFSLTWNQPWRLLFYESIAVLLALFSYGLLAFLGKRALVLTNMLLCRFMGTDYSILANNGQALVQNWIIAIEKVLMAIYHGFTKQIFFSHEFIYTPCNNLALTIASFVFAINLLFFGGLIIAYGISSFTIGNTLSYLVLRYKKDGENLLERKDKEEEEEQGEADVKEQQQASSN